MFNPSEIDNQDLALGSASLKSTHGQIYRDVPLSLNRKRSNFLNRMVPLIQQSTYSSCERSKTEDGHRDEIYPPSTQQCVVSTPQDGHPSLELKTIKEAEQIEHHLAQLQDDTQRSSCRMLDQLDVEHKRALHTYNLLGLYQNVVKVRILMQPLLQSINRMPLTVVALKQLLQFSDELLFVHENDTKVDTKNRLKHVRLQIIRLIKSLHQLQHLTLSRSSLYSHLKIKESVSLGSESSLQSFIDHQSSIYPQLISVIDSWSTKLDLSRAIDFTTFQTISCSFKTRFQNTFQLNKSRIKRRCHDLHRMNRILGHADMIPKRTKPSLCLDIYNDQQFYHYLLSQYLSDDMTTDTDHVHMRSELKKIRPPRTHSHRRNQIDYEQHDKLVSFIAQTWIITFCPTHVYRMASSHHYLGSHAIYHEQRCSQIISILCYTFNDLFLPLTREWNAPFTVLLLFMVVEEKS